MNLIILHDYLHMGPVAYWRTLDYILNDHIEKNLLSVTTPICIIRGSRDGISPAKWVDYLASTTHESEVHHIAGGPHNVQYADPQEVFVICKQFLEK